MIKVSGIVDVQEMNGVRPAVGEGPGIAVKSHWNNSAYVVIVIGATEYAVRAGDIEAAVQNAQNSNRHG